MKRKHIIRGQGQLLHVHKAWRGKGAGLQTPSLCQSSGKKMFKQTSIRATSL